MRFQSKSLCAVFGAKAAEILLMGVTEPSEISNWKVCQTSTLRGDRVVFNFGCWGRYSYRMRMFSLSKSRNKFKVLHKIFLHRSLCIY